MSLEAARLEVEERNAVRRAAKLPLLDVEREVQAVLDREQAKKWNKAAERHADELTRIRNTLLAAYRQRTGKDRPDNFGGGLSLHIRAGLLFADFLLRQGYRRTWAGRTEQDAGHEVLDLGEREPSSNPGTAQASDP